MYNTSKLILNNAISKGDQIAFKLENESISFRDIFLMARETSNVFQKTERNENFAICCNSVRNFFISLYSCLLSATPVILISSTISEKELSNLCNQFKVKNLITDKDCKKLSKKYNCILPMSEVTNHYFDENEYSDVRAHDIAFFLMTSGTTGKKRAVPITHKNLIWTGRKFNEFMQISESQSEMVLIPFSHSFGVRRIIAQMLLGGTILGLNGNFNPASALLEIKKNNCSVLSLVPSQVRMFMQYFKNDFVEVAKGIKFIELSSEYMAPHEKKELVKIASNAQIIMGYGLTEATRSALLHLNLQMDKINTSGKPISGIEIIILDKNNNPVSYGVEGQVVIKGPNVANSYFLSNLKDNENFKDDCFLTGDLGFMDMDGFLSITGRIDDIINVGGKKFNPIEIELDLREKFPNDDCAISHIPDNILGSRPVLCVEGEKNNAKDMMEYIINNYESFKHPFRVINMNEINRTENGKIIRSILKHKVLTEINKVK